MQQTPEMQLSGRLRALMGINFHNCHTTIARICWYLDVITQ